MERLTRKTQQGYEVQDTAAAVLRLAQFENFYDGLTDEQRTLAEKLAALKAQGKKNSVQFRQLLSRKMELSSMLILLKTYGIGEEGAKKFSDTEY